MVKEYNGRIPACGCFCGGCPMFIRDKNPCPGAELNIARCENCKSYHLCCQTRGISHCFECSNFPCARFKSFAKRWQKHGQDLLENQEKMKEMGTNGFLKLMNESI